MNQFKVFTVTIVDTTTSMILKHLAAVQTTASAYV